MCSCVEGIHGIWVQGHVFDICVLVGGGPVERFMLGFMAGGGLMGLRSEFIGVLGLFHPVAALVGGLIWTRCSVDSKVSRVAWLNRTTILFAGREKWSLDPRVILMENTAITEYSIKIQNVNIHDEGPYVCSILTNKKPKSTKVHLIVQGPLLEPLQFAYRAN
ncbi:hypothetical protein AMECASPLE_021916, partial [Ameca splendens]